MFVQNQLLLLDIFLICKITGHINFNTTVNDILDKETSFVSHELELKNSELFV